MVLNQRGIFVTTKDGVLIPDQIRLVKTHLNELYVSNKLTRVRDCFVNYRYPIKKSTIVNQSNEIPIHDQYSHTMRALEYFFVNYNPTFKTGGPFSNYVNKAFSYVRHDPNLGI